MGVLRWQQNIYNGSVNGCDLCKYFTPRLRAWPQFVLQLSIDKRASDEWRRKLGPVICQHCRQWMWWNVLCAESWIEGTTWHQLAEYRSRFRLASCLLIEVSML